MIKYVKSFYENQSGAVKGLAKGVLWSFIGSVLSRGLTFLSWILVARILGPEQNGEFGIIRTTVLMFMAFAAFGLGLTGTKFISQYIHTDRDKAGRIASLTLSFSFIMGVLVMATVFFFSDMIATTTLKAPYLAGDLKITSLILFMSSLNGAQMGILEGLKQFKVEAGINAVNAIVSLPIFIIGAYFYGTSGSVVAFTISNVLLCLQSHIAIRKQEKRGVIKLDFRNGWKEWKLLYVFSLPSALAGLAVMPIKWYADVMLVDYSGFVAMGIFSAVLTVNNVIVTLANTINAPFLSYLAANDSSGSGDVTIDKLNIVLPWFIGVVIGLPFLCFPFIGGYLFGKEYQGQEFDVSFVLVILFTIIIMYKQGPTRIFIVNNMQWFGFLVNICWGISLVFSFYALRGYGAIGLAAAYCLAYLLSCIITIPLYIKRGWVSWNFFLSPYSLAIWIFTFIVAYISLYDMSIILRILICAMSYVLFIYLFKKLSGLRLV